MDCLTPDPQAAIHRSTKRPACNYCKKRKIKCDGLANCFQCQKRGLKCEYTTSTTNECGVVARLTKRVCRLASELEEQKKLADYWRAQFEELKCQKYNQSELVCAQRPELCVESQEACSDVSDAVSSVLNAFLEVTRALLPASTIEHNLNNSTMIWTKLVDNKSNEVVARIRLMNLDTIIEALYYSSVFALGSRLHQDDDLAVHFHQIADGLLSSTSNIAENYCKINADAARQIALSHVYSLFYYKASGMFTSISWSWQQTAEFIRKISANLAQDTNDEISAWIMLFAPTSKRDLCQMEATNGTTESFLLKNIALAFRLLSQLHLGTESIAQQAWNLVIEAESHLVNIQASSNYTFYCVLIYALKALAAVNMPHEMNEEINRCTQIVAHLYTQVPSSSEQVWLSRDIEYLHHILTELQQEMSDIYGYDLMLDVVENIQFMFLTSPTVDMCTSGSELSSPSAESLESIESIESMDSLPYNYSANQFMHPLVIYSPFATSC